MILAVNANNKGTVMCVAATGKIIRAMDVHQKSEHVQRCACAAHVNFAGSANSEVPLGAPNETWSCRENRSCDRWPSEK